MASVAHPLELAIFALLAVVAYAYLVEPWLSQPGLELLGGLVPGALDADRALVALGILGAVVMPHNLFLHSGLVLARRRPDVPLRRLLRRPTVESAVALNLALLVNAAILITAARPSPTAGWSSSRSGRPTRPCNRCSRRAQR